MSKRRRGRPRREVPEDLGVLPDTVIAAREGVHPDTVRGWRLVRGVDAAVPRGWKGAEESAQIRADLPEDPLADGRPWERRAWDDF